MIHYLKGAVIESSPLEIILDVNGVGYSVQIPITTAEKIPPLGETCELFIHPSSKKTHQLNLFP